MGTHVEHEVKLAVDADASVPDLHDLPGVREVTTVVVDLDAQYWDAADLALLRARTTLRRRTGGDDEGWHLKRPDAGDERRRTELELRRRSDGFS